LASLEPNVAATGHGVPMAGEPMRRGLEALLRDWGRVAVPPQGRYFNRPAVTDETGVRSVPPLVFDPQLLVAVGVGAAVLMGATLLGAQETSRR
jgi:hypothetical protein